jgi:hypothetical protein
VGFFYDSCMSTSDDPMTGGGHPTAVPAPRLRRADREQLLPPMPLNDLLTDDHQARVVWRFVERLDLTPVSAPLKGIPDALLPTRVSSPPCG